MIAMIDVEKHYASNLDKWCKEGASNVEDGLNSFIERIQNNFNLYLTYDNRLSSAAIRLMNNFEYIEYNQKQQYRNQLKNILGKIIRVLYIENFLTIDDYQKLTNALSTCYLSKELDKFIEMVTFQQRQLSQHEIETFWKNSVRRNFEYTWSFFSKNNIFDEKIVKFFEISQPIIKKCSLQKIQEINQYHDKNKRIQFTKTLRIKDVNTSSIQLKNELNLKLDKLISQKCLFLNKIMLDKAILQIKTIVQVILDKNHEENVTYDLYGSLRTGFALTFYSDADITINYTNKESSRERKIMKLQEIYYNLKKEEQTLDYFKIQLLASPRIRNPLVKINFDTKRQYKDRSPVSSIDILIDSPIGVENSKILELYSKSIPIVKLVCLVKYWGKRKNLINPKRFSSYGITLMVLYFLIKTNQAPYIIKASQSYRLQKALISQKQFSPLLQNFVAFLDFYRYQGYFFTQKKPVCLMQMSGLQTDDNILINMHDFIDGSNPGRVTKIIEQKFFTIINKTIQKLRLSVDLSDIMGFEE